MPVEPPRGAEHPPPANEQLPRGLGLFLARAGALLKKRETKPCPQRNVTLAIPPAVPGAKPFALLLFKFVRPGRARIIPKAAAPPGANAAAHLSVGMRPAPAAKGPPPPCVLTIHEPAAAGCRNNRRRTGKRGRRAVPAVRPRGKCARAIAFAAAASQCKKRGKRVKAQCGAPKAPRLKAPENAYVALKSAPLSPSQSPTPSPQ